MTSGWTALLEMSGPKTLYGLCGRGYPGALGSAARGIEGRAVQRPQLGLSRMVHWIIWRSWVIGEGLHDDMSMFKEA